MDLSKVSLVLGKIVEQENVTAKMIENDSTYDTFLSVTKTVEADNTSTQQSGSNQEFPRRVELLDRTNVTVLMREKYDRWLGAIESQEKFGVNLPRDVESAIDDMLTDKNPDNLRMQDIFKTMAMKAGQVWSPDADLLLDEDIERAQKLYIKAPQMKNRVDKLKIDARLFQLWEQDMKNLPFERN